MRWPSGISGWPFLLSLLFHDASDKPAIVEFNGNKYAYVHNLQGDIVAILDRSKNVVVSYVYDAWGRHISKTGSMANTLGKINPFRYRGYVYDEETRLHYLRSRFYSYSTSRFVNADSVVSTKSDCINVYSYCSGNPIILADASGTNPILVILLTKIAHTVGVFFVVKGLFYHATKEGWLDGAINAFGFRRDPVTGCFHANQNCWQQIFGYYAIYDVAFDIATQMETAQYEFTSGGIDYVVWIWKGDYLNLGLGAELGLYKGTVSKGCTVDTACRLNTQLVVIYDGKEIINCSSPASGEWWTTGFNPQYQGEDASKLRVIYTVVFPNQTMYNDFKYSNSNRELTFIDDTATVVIEF